MLPPPIAIPCARGTASSRDLMNSSTPGIGHHSDSTAASGWAPVSGAGCMQHCAVLGSWRIRRICGKRSRTVIISRAYRGC